MKGKYKEQNLYNFVFMINKLEMNSGEVVVEDGFKTVKNIV